MIFSLKIKLNLSKNLECAFGVAGNILMSRIQWNLFGKIWIQNVGDIDVQMIFVAESSNKYQKTMCWKEKSVEEMVRIEGLLFNSSMISFHIWLFKKLIHTLQNNVHMLSFPILLWVYTWANNTTHTSFMLS